MKKPIIEKKKITQISFDVHIVAQIQGKDASTLQALTMLKEENMVVSIPDIYFNEPVIILKDRSL